MNKIVKEKGEEIGGMFSFAPMVVLGRFLAVVSASFGGCFRQLVGSFLEFDGWSNGGMWWGFWV